MFDSPLSIRSVNRASPSPRKPLFSDFPSSPNGEMSENLPPLLSSTSPYRRASPDRECRRPPVSGLSRRSTSSVIPSALVETHSHFSRFSVLPEAFPCPISIEGMQDQCNTISAYALASLLSQTHTVQQQQQRVLIIDCRYGYEFEGGHIANAVNLPDPSAVESFFFGHIGQQIPLITPDTLVVFHCEHSVKRGPRMLGHLRSLDRTINRNAYPGLCWPNVVLLKSGYANFVAQFPQFCTPEGGYVPMTDDRYSNDFNRSSGEARKSWNMRRGSSFHGRQSLPS
ncbi:mitochondrial rhodanase homology domain (RHOD) superfamily [Andalucia godoyi]|uniref:protein-tyrosine-phosphatase n=1 Tax=Andalucia godoyi TaxID=505711 RepID=A0A8K0AIE7_ANDGO|nr:mitochondrial rhodanase homology domain (RHOD) superfamily [Andalucia godoyi]|eukprot:ANDGO_07525.mRNA.1 mitochondrial rhodanase homology domain (RHOD) superfamily